MMKILSDKSPLYSTINCVKHRFAMLPLSGKYLIVSIPESFNNIYKIMFVCNDLSLLCWHGYISTVLWLNYNIDSAGIQLECGR